MAMTIRRHRGREVRQPPEVRRGGATVLAGAGTASCGTSLRPTPAGAACDPITADLYDATPRPTACPPTPCGASLGCGNPTALAELTPARPCSTSARAAASTCCSRPAASGPTGKAYGLDMTDDMLDARAREPAQRAALTNVEFLKGEIEAHPAARRARST